MTDGVILEKQLSKKFLSPDNTKCPENKFPTVDQSLDAHPMQIRGIDVSIVDLSVSVDSRSQRSLLSESTSGLQQLNFTSNILEENPLGHPIGPYNPPRKPKPNNVVTVFS